MRKRRTFYACPQKRVNLAEFEEEETAFLHDEYHDEVDDVHIYRIEGESLIVCSVMAMPGAEKED